MRGRWFQDHGHHEYPASHLAGKHTLCITPFQVTKVAHATLQLRERKSKSHTPQGLNSLQSHKPEV
jgi:hypothetical protein